MENLAALSTAIPEHSAAFVTRWRSGEPVSGAPVIAPDRALWLCPARECAAVGRALRALAVTPLPLETTSLPEACMRRHQQYGRLDICFIARSNWRDGPPTAAYCAYLHLLQTLGRFQPASLTVITQRSIPCTEEDYPLYPLDGLYVGMAQTLCRELPRIAVRIFSLHNFSEQNLRAALAWRGDIAPHHPIVIRAGRPLIPQMIPAEPAKAPEARPFRQQGVYLIIGGGGGIGGALARWLAQRWQARLILIGRRPAAAQQALLAELRALGADDAQYRQLDVGREPDALTALIQQLPELHGIVHSAIALHDRTLLRMTEDELLSAIRPKIHGSYALAEGLKGRPVDWVLFFSSIQSWTAHEGQANYTGACVTKDAVAAFIRHALLIPSKVVNWGFWGSVGVAANDALRQAMQRLHIGSVEPEEALAFLDRFLGDARYDQLAFLKASDRALAERDIALPSAITTELPEVEASYQLDRYARQRIKARIAGLEDEVVPAYQPLLEAVTAMPEVEGEEALTAAQLLAQYPFLASHLRLLDACLEAWPAVVTGRKTALSALFPAGDTGLLRAYYESNYLNEQVREQVKRFTAQRGPLRIMEAGAGTGSTTAQVVGDPAIPIEEYLFSDVSGVFLREARQRFQHWPFMQYRLADIVNDAALPADYYDVAIATNVLHAVSDIPRALQQVFHCLKPGGMAVLNEAVDRHDFLTVTFGLLDGWWHPPASGVTRIAHTPLLSVPTWRDLLQQAGFTRVEQVGDRRQSLIIAYKPASVTLAQPIQHKEESMKENVLTPDVAPMRAATPDRAAIAEQIRQIIAEIVLLEPTEIEADKPFTDYGIDSILALNITEGLQRRFGALPDTVLFSYPCVDQLAAYLAQRAAPTPASDAPAAPAVADTVRRIVAQVTMLEEADLVADEKLENYGIDSIIALAIVEALSKVFGPLPETLLFEQDTLAKLTAFLAARQTPSPAAPAASAPQPSLLTDHVILGQPLLPATWTLAQAYQQTGARLLRNLRWLKPVIDLEAVTFKTYRNETFAICGAARSAQYAQGSFSRDTPAATPFTPPALSGATVYDQAQLYPHLAARGYHYGPAFQCIRQIALGEQAALAVLYQREADAFTLSPYLLDAGLQTSILLIPATDAAAQSVMLPSHLHRLTVHHPLPIGEPLYCYATRTVSAIHHDSARFDFCFYDARQTLLVEIKGLLSVRATQAQLQNLQRVETPPPAATAQEA